MAQHWIARGTAGHEAHGQYAVYDEATGKDIAIVYDGKAHGGLIAAAPELAEALRAVLDPPSYYSDVRERARALLERIEG